MRFNGISSKIVAVGIIAMFFTVMLTVIPTETDGAALAANKTEILFDGEEIHGLKGFTYKVYKDRQDVRGIGGNERLGVVYGRLHVKGKILVHSNSELLDNHMNRNSQPMHIVLSIMQDSYPEGLGIKQCAFERVQIDDRKFQIDSHGYALTTYSFSAHNFVLYGDNLVWQERFDIIFPGEGTTYHDCFPTRWDTNDYTIDSTVGGGFITALSHVDSYGSQLITAKYADAETGDAGIVGWWGDSLDEPVSLLAVADPVFVLSEAESGIGDAIASAAIASPEDLSLMEFLLNILDGNPLAELLNKHMDNNTHFQIILSLAPDGYWDDNTIKAVYVFDGVQIDDREFQIDSHGYALTTYTFTADRLREA